MRATWVRAHHVCSRAWNGHAYEEATLALPLCSKNRLHQILISHNAFFNSLLVPQLAKITMGTDALALTLKEDGEKVMWERSNDILIA